MSSSGSAPRARATRLIPSDVESTVKNLVEYTKPYQEILGLREHADHLQRMVEGLTSNLERKSIEPIALMHGIPRRGLQRFVGENGWDHRPLVERQRLEVESEIGVEDGTLVVDGSATPKKGTKTVGIKRQWCGRLGKIDNCVVGVHAVYVGASELATLVASELYLPREWLEDVGRREQASIPSEVQYRSQAKIAKDMVSELITSGLRFGWVLGDDEFGRATEFRDAIAGSGKNYVLDVPENTVVRRQTVQGHLRDKQWKVSKLRRQLHDDEWTFLYVRDGQKGPIEVRAAALPVATRRRGSLWERETLLIIETVDESQRWYCLARAPRETPLAELVRRAGQRHKIEEVFEEAKGEIGLDHFEVRAWHGWHHHMTLCQLAHWFLVREKRRLGGKSSWHHREPDPDGNCAVARGPLESDKSGTFHQLSLPAQLRGEGRSVQGSWFAPAPTGIAVRCAAQ